MPIYEFSCDKCGFEFEEVVRSNEIPICPECGSNQTHRLMSACARFRGNAGQDSAGGASSGGGCAGCSGGNCGSCGR